MSSTATSDALGLRHEVELAEEGAAHESELKAAFVGSTEVDPAVVEGGVEVPISDLKRDSGLVLDGVVVHSFNLIKSGPR